jgi:hypothetical protein
MSSIHPKPQLVFLRDDGDGGLDLVMKTSTGALEVHPLRPKDAATWLAQLSEFVGRKFREEVVVKEASHV